MLDINVSFEPLLSEPKPEPRDALLEADRVKSLQELDVQAELLEQYKSAKRLFVAAEYDEGIPLNQKAQSLNTISTVLSSITKLQTELYDSERLKVLEATLIDVLREYPTVQAEFIRRYEERLNVQ